MIFLETVFTPTKLHPYPTRVMTPVVPLESIEVMPNATADVVAESIASNYLYSRGKQALLNELRGILLNEFFVCTNPFDTVALTNRAITLLDEYETKLSDDIRRFDILGPSYPNIIIPNDDFNKFLSNYLK